MCSMVQTQDELSIFKAKSEKNCLSLHHGTCHTKRKPTVQMLVLNQKVVATVSACKLRKLVNGELERQKGPSYCLNSNLVCRHLANLCCTRIAPASA